MSDRGDEESLTSPEPLVSPSTDDATTPANRRTRVCPLISPCTRDHDGFKIPNRFHNTQSLCIFSHSSGCSQAFYD